MTTKNPRGDELCPQCGERVYTVKGLRHDQDGLRDNRWCEDCKTMFSCHAEGLYARLVLKDKYEGTAKERIEGLLKLALQELVRS